MRSWRNGRRAVLRGQWTKVREGSSPFGRTKIFLLEVYMLYCYHGTNEENAKLILKNGFRPKTYFAHHLEDALAFGGKYVFRVEFEEDKFSDAEDRDRWQFWIVNTILPDKIKSLTKYEKEVIALQ